jgi:hypothetical protein
MLRRRAFELASRRLQRYLDRVEVEIDPAHPGPYEPIPPPYRRVVRKKG